MYLLSIIVPIYNEEATIHLILDKIKKVNLNHNGKIELIEANKQNMKLERKITTSRIRMPSALQLKDTREYEYEMRDD